MPWLAHTATATLRPGPRSAAAAAAAACPASHILRPCEVWCAAVTGHGVWRVWQGVTHPSDFAEPDVPDKLPVDDAHIVAWFDELERYRERCQAQEQPTAQPALAAGQAA